MEEKKIEKPDDLKLQEAMAENINLLQQLKGLNDLVIWIKFFLLFAIVIMILILLKAYRVV